MSKPINLVQHTFYKKIKTEFPTLISSLHEIIKILKPYENYVGIKQVIQSCYDSIYQMESSLEMVNRGENER